MPFVPCRAQHAESAATAAVLRQCVLHCERTTTSRTDSDDCRANPRRCARHVASVSHGDFETNPAPSSSGEVWLPTRSGPKVCRAGSGRFDDAPGAVKINRVGPTRPAGAPRVHAPIAGVL